MKKSVKILAVVAIVTGFVAVVVAHLHKKEESDLLDDAFFDGDDFYDGFEDDDDVDLDGADYD